MSQYVIDEASLGDPSLAADRLAAAAHHRVQYLLTWNCKHIANAKVLPRIAKLLNGLSIPMPVICTPEELLEDDPANAP